MNVICVYCFSFRTIQELTISLGKATTTTELSGETGEHQEIHTKTKAKFSEFLNKILQEIRSVNCI